VRSELREERSVSGVRTYSFNFTDYVDGDRNSENIQLNANCKLFLKILCTLYSKYTFSINPLPDF